MGLDQISAVGSVWMGSALFQSGDGLGKQLSLGNSEERNVQHLGILIPQSALRALGTAVPVVNSM